MQRKSVGDIVLLKVNGSVTFSDEHTLKSALHRITTEGKKKIAVDCSRMDALNDNALSAFLKAYRTFKDGHVAFAGPNAHVRRVFQESHLDTLFEIHETIDDAVESLRHKD
ncbi:MAG: STAS domain-containing protein [bacterium]